MGEISDYGRKQRNGAKTVELRKKEGLKQEALADEAGISGPGGGPPTWCAVSQREGMTILEAAIEYCVDPEWRNEWRNEFRNAEEGIKLIVKATLYIELARMLGRGELLARGFPTVGRVAGRHSASLLGGISLGPQ